MENNGTIGSKILALRKAKGYTQADLGAYLNISYQAVSKWEREESCPDFETLSKIAQFFNVPITYFERGTSELATTATPVVSATPVNGADKTMLGVCKDCGKVVYEGQEGLLSPTLVCKECVERRQKLAEAKATEQRRQAERQAKERENKRRLREAEIIHGRNKGLWWGGILSAIWLVLSIVVSIAQSDITLFLGNIPACLFGFCFISQLFWDGAVATCASAGAHIGTPGVIFDLSLDGFIFLIFAKILFAVIRLLVFLVTSAVCIIVAFLISPFTFFFALKRVNEGDLVD